MLDLKKQLMALESVNNMHQVAIEEKDEKIRRLSQELNELRGKKGGFAIESEEQYLNMIKENSDLKIQIQQMAQQLEMSASRLEQLTGLMESDEARKKADMEDMRNYSKLQEMEMLKSDLERKLDQERERNRALRFKAGQVFMSALEKGAVLNPAAKKQSDGDYYLADDEALMRLLQRIEQLGEPGL